jgi:Ca2+-transporting ATPase
MKKWWHLGVEEIARMLGADARTGLSSAAAEKRLETHGANELQEKQGRGPLAIFVDQFKGLIIWVLIGAALVSGFLKEWVDALAILTIVLLNAVLGLVQEYRAEKSLAALKKLSAPSSRSSATGPSVSSRPGSSFRAISSRSKPATTSRPTAGSAGTPRISASRKPA